MTASGLQFLLARRLDRALEVTAAGEAQDLLDPNFEVPLESISLGGLFTLDGPVSIWKDSLIYGAK